MVIRGDDDDDGARPWKEVEEADEGWKDVPDDLVSDRICVLGSNLEREVGYEELDGTAVWSGGPLAGDGVGAGAGRSDDDTNAGV